MTGVTEKGIPCIGPIMQASGLDWGGEGGGDITLSDR